MGRFIWTHLISCVCSVLQVPLSISRITRIFYGRASFIKELRTHSQEPVVMQTDQTDLWQDHTRSGNLLPRDGIVEYRGDLFDSRESDSLFQALRASIDWQHDEVIMFGRRRVLSRMVAWQGDESFSYIYAGTSKTATQWTPELLPIKERVERTSAVRFNSCLLNFYQDGSEGMGWHSDDESSLGRNPVIASVSFGSERVFKFKHRATKEVVAVALGHGSLLMMKGATQHHWVHALPKSTRISSPRINLTFRLFTGAPTGRHGEQG